MFGLEPDPAYPLAAFLLDAGSGMIGRLVWHEDGRPAPGFLATWSEAQGPGAAGF